ncbi:hypothetical protein FB381_1495 [Nocardioides albertanoniae]|uniref:Uncharacterized protein n=1 Tax=Nocardioides albertanoniae TaxID=1175486 RepID=A0A543A4Z0_9ACTN|nr:hypothetical protein [Nocardioides albertanoniae]TQL67614.1 hypothetical protein FB381_1495 [Nocardioides albertanoniae]
MTKLSNRVLARIGAAALAIATLAATSPSQASANTYTPHGVPATVMIGNDVAFTFDDAGQTFICEQFDLQGSLTDPGLSRPFGTSAITLNQLVDGGCFNSIFGDTTFDMTGTWGFAITGPEVGSESTATLIDADMFFSAADCEFNITGEITGVFDDTSGVFTATGSSLTIADVPVGFICGILGLAQGQSISVESGIWTISSVTISNP